MFAGFIFILGAIALGTAITSVSKTYSEKIGAISIGSISGLAFAITVAYLAQLAIPLSTVSVLIQAVLLLSTAIYIFYQQGWHSFREMSLDKRAAIVLLLSAFIFSIIAPKLLITHEGGLATGIINAYGDVAWHAANVTSFAEGQSLPPENPIFAGHRLTYPFLVNFFSSLLVVTGFSLEQSIVLPALLLIPILLTLLYCFVRDYTRNPNAALLAVALFLFGGGTLGWMRIGADFADSGQSLLEFITHLPIRDYSGAGTDPQGFHFLNPVTSLLLPQRSFLFGIPIALSVLTLLRPREKEAEATYLIAGIIAGLLPLFHGHTTISLTIALIALIIINPSKRWFVFILTGVIIGLPEMLYYVLGDNESGSFFRFAPFWMAGEEDNLLWYWIKNTGLFIPTAIIALFTPAPRPTKALGISGLSIFILANTLLFAPWAWDNFKLLVFFFLLNLPLVAWAVTYAWKKVGVPLRVIIAALIAAHTLSAGLDIWKLALPTTTVWEEWSANGLVMAQRVQEHTNPGDTILTAPTHNSAVVLAGRPRYLGYSAHVWSHGSDPSVREEAIGDFYGGKITTVPEASIQYILVGPQERAMYQNIIIQPNWTLVTQYADYALYQLNPTPPIQDIN